MSRRRSGTRDVDRSLFVSEAEIDEEFDLRELLGVLWRRKFMILGCTVATLAVAAVVLAQLTPRYTAYTDVLLSDQKTNLADDVEAVVSRLTEDVETSEIVETEIQVIRSRDLVAKTVDELDLHLNPEFNESLRPPTLVQRVFSIDRYVPEDWLKAVGLREPPPSISEEERARRERQRVIDVFLERLDVSQMGMSRVLRISFESEDPETSARVANTLTQFYIVSQLDTKLEATQNANRWLIGRSAELRAQVQAAEQAAAEFRIKSGLVGSEEAATVSEQQAAQLNAALIEAQAQKADVEARLEQARALAAAPSGAASAAEVLQSPLIQSLREQEAELRREAAELSQQYGERHPLMRNVQAKMNDIRANIAAEITRIVQALEGEARVAASRVAALEDALAEAEAKVADLNAAAVQLRALEREADASRTLLETFLVRSKETSAQESFQTADAVVISPAVAPERPSFPKKVMLMGIASFAGLGLGVFCAFAREALDPGFRSLDQIEKITGLTPLGLVPALTGLRRLGHNPATYLLAHPLSAWAESLRNLYSVLVLSDVQQQPKIIMFASSMPGEGKTSTAVALACLVASLGKRVVVVDCDLRRPTTHELMSLPRAPGLANYLEGSAGLEDVIHHEPHSGVDLVPCGQATKRSLISAIGSTALGDLIKMLSEHYDLVLIDTAPVLATADARILLSLVDKVVFVTRWARTRRKRVLGGLRVLAGVGRNKLAGALLTMVDVKKHAQYDYSDSGHYYGPITRYYHR